MTTQPTGAAELPEALRLAEILEGDYCPDWFYEQGVDEVSKELRLQHALLNEQQRTIEALNACINGEGSTTTENLRLVDRLHAQVEALRAQPAGAATPAAAAQEPVDHDWKHSSSYGGDLCATCGAVKGTRRGKAPCVERAMKPTPVGYLYDWVSDDGVVRDWFTQDYDEAHSPTNQCHNIRPLYTHPSPQPAVTAGTVDALTVEDAKLLEKAVTDFEECGETDVPDADLRRFAAMGLLECAHYNVLPAAQEAIDAALAAQRGGV